MARKGYGIKICTWVYAREARVLISGISVQNTKGNPSYFGFAVPLDMKFVLLYDFWKCIQAIQYGEMREHLLTAASLLVTTHFTSWSIMA